MTQADLAAPQLQQVDDLRRKLSFGIDRAEMDGPLEQRLREMGSGLRLKGFRPGKVPMRLLRERYGKDALNEVVGDRAKRSIEEFLKREPRRLAHQPSVRVTPAEDRFEVVCEFDEMPEVPVPDISALEVVRPEAELTEEDFEWTFRNMLRRFGKPRPVDRAAAEGDQVTVRFKFSAGGMVAWDTQGNAFPVQLTHDGERDPFVDGLIGAKAGDTGTFTMRIGGNHPNERLRGRDGEVDFGVEQVAEHDFSDLDAALKAAFQSDMPAAELREKLKGGLRGDVEGTVMRLLSDRVVKALLDAVPEFALPQTLVALEVREGLNSLQEQVKQMLYPAREFLEWDVGEIERLARRKVRLGLILRAIAESIGYQPSQREIQQFLAGQVEAGESAQENFEAAAERYRTDQRFAASVNGALTESAVFRHVVATARVSAERIPFQGVREELRAKV